MRPYYEHAGITIFNCDCREILPHLDPVDLVLTDPPYALGGSKPEYRVTASVAIGLDHASRRVKRKGTMAVFTTTSGRGIEYVLGAVNPTLPFNRLLVWHKRFVNSAVAGPWRWDLVSILLFGRGTWGRPQWSSMVESEASTENGHEDTGHPAQVPENVAEWLWLPFEEEVETVLDPFLGVGSLLYPARLSGKRVIGCEIEERYCEIAARRLAQEILPFGEGGGS